jgi:hypothetical protein
MGEVVTTDECMRRMSNYEENEDFYFASLGGGLMLDAKPMGSVARFANHCCDPNSELQKWTVLGEPRIALVSKWALKAGTEITYNYQYHDDGLDALSSTMKRQKCLCGAQCCSGTIGGKVVESVSDVWKTKARALISTRKSPLSVLRDHISDKLLEENQVPPNCNEVREIQMVIQASESYTKAVNLFLRDESDVVWRKPKNFKNIKRDSSSSKSSQKTLKSRKWAALSSEMSKKLL